MLCSLVSDESPRKQTVEVFESTKIPEKKNKTSWCRGGIVWVFWAAASSLQFNLALAVKLYYNVVRKAKRVSVYRCTLSTVWWQFYAIHSQKISEIVLFGTICG